MYCYGYIPYGYLYAISVVPAWKQDDCSFPMCFLL